MRKGFTWLDLLVVTAFICILGATIVPYVLKSQEDAKQAKEQTESWSHVDYAVLGEGRFDKVYYNYDGQQHTMVYFQDGPVVHMAGINSIGHDRGDKIRISQKRLGAGTKYEKMELIYKVELLEAEAK